MKKNPYNRILSEEFKEQYLSNVPNSYPWDKFENFMFFI